MNKFSISFNSIIALYSVLYVVNLVLEVFLTKQILEDFFKSNNSSSIPAYLIYEVLYPKLLQLLEVFFLTNFIFAKTKNSIYQIIVIKLIRISIWLFLAIRYYFGSEYICFAICSVSQFILLGFITEHAHSIIYRKYNHQISMDPDIITLHIINQIITALLNLSLIHI